jgi:hypothetical protein
MLSLLTSHSTQTKTSLRLALLALALPIAGFSTALQASGNGGSTTVCEFGVACPDPFNTATAVGISPSPISNSGSFNFVYTFADLDQYTVTGTWSANYINSTYVIFNPTVTYLGYNGDTTHASVGTDTLTLDLYQNFYDNTPGTWSGPPAACEYFGVTVAPNSSATADLSYGGQQIGTLSAGPGTTNQSLCTVLTIPPPTGTAPFLASDFDMTFTFPGSTAPGTQTSLAPEPTTATLGLLGIGSALLLTARRKA